MIVSRGSTDRPSRGILNVSTVTLRVNEWSTFGNGRVRSIGKVQIIVGRGNCQNLSSKKIPLKSLFPNTRDSETSDRYRPRPVAGNIHYRTRKNFATARSPRFTRNPHLSQDARRPWYQRRLGSLRVRPAPRAQPPPHRPRAPRRAAQGE